MDKQVVDLQERHVRAILRRIEDLEQSYVQLSRAVRRARIYAGENLPANKGLTIVTMLEKALAGESS